MYSARRTVFIYSATHTGNTAQGRNMAIKSPTLSDRQMQKFIKKIGGKDVIIGILNGSLQCRVETVETQMRGCITRYVHVDRTRTPRQVLKATGRKQYVEKSALATMPRGEGQCVEMIFFKLGHFISDDDLAKEYYLRDLSPDPYAQAAINAADPAFAYFYPNCTHWIGVAGRWCFATFYESVMAKRGVNIGHDSAGWSGNWWFGGRR